MKFQTGDIVQYDPDAWEGLAAEDLALTFRVADARWVDPDEAGFEQRLNLIGHNHENVLTGFRNTDFRRLPLGAGEGEKDAT